MHFRWECRTRAGSVDSGTKVRDRSSPTGIAPGEACVRFIRRHELIRLTGLSLYDLDRLERAGAFPLRRRLSAGAVGWIDAEIEEWLKSRATAATEQALATTDAISPFQSGLGRF